MIPAAKLDPAVAYLLQLLETDDIEAERLVRMGAHGVTSVSVATRRLRVLENVLTRRLRARGLPNPLRLLTWGRLIATMLEWDATAEDGGRPGPIQEIYDRLDWSNRARVSQSMRRYAGMTPTEWRLGGRDIEGLCDAFVRTWRARVGQEAAA